MQISFSAALDPPPSPFPLVPAERKPPSALQARGDRIDLSRFRVGFDEHMRRLIQMSPIKQHLEGFTPLFLLMCAFSSHLLLPVCSKRFPPGRAAAGSEDFSEQGAGSSRRETFASFFGEDFCSLTELGGRGGVQANRAPCEQPRSPLGALPVAPLGCQGKRSSF